jgi:hypothetical protein
MHITSSGVYNVSVAATLAPAAVEPQLLLAK